MEKYWPTHPEIIYSTETVVNPFYQTVCKNYPINQWTRRIRETAQEIEDESILLMVDDVFLRRSFDFAEVEKLNGILFSDKNIASINLETKFDSKDSKLNDLVSVRSREGKYKLSLMCQIWKKPCLLDVLGIDSDPWKFENLPNEKHYQYCILNKELIDWGHHAYGDKWGVVKGKWSQECRNFFLAEGISVDYSKRGFFN